MGTNRKSESNFLVQGSVLAIASIISRIIGLLYRIPLTAVLGDYGNDYYGVAMNVYSILLLISSNSIPLAVSKLVSTRVAKGQRNNAYRIFKGALAFALISGLIAGLIIYFGAGAISVFFKTPLSIFALKVLAPTLLVVAILGVIRGFFQGLGTMMPSAVSQLIEQLVNAVVSIWVAYVLYDYGIKIGSVLGNSNRYGEAYAAAGGTLGTGAGALFALGFTVFVFIVYMPIYKRQMKKEPQGTVEGYGTIFRLLIFTIVPVLLSTTIYNISTVLDLRVFKQLASYQGMAEETYSEMWGILSGKYKTLIHVPIAIASSLAASSVPSISTAFSSGNKNLVRRKVSSSTRFIMVIAFPCAVGMAVLASPILQLTYNESRALPAQMLQVGAVSILFYSISTLSNAILQGINQMRVPVYNAIIALVLHVASLCVLMLGFHLNIYAVIIAESIFALIMCILNGLAIRKHIQYKQEVLRTFILPGIASVGMGAVVYGMYYLMIKVIKINAVSTFVSILIGVLVYGILLLLLRGLNEEDLHSFPKGYLIVNIAKKLHLLK